MKRITLKELGNEYSDEFVVTVFGQAAEQPTYGNVVAAKLRFLVTEYQGKNYQEVSADELLVIG